MNARLLILVLAPVVAIAGYSPPARASFPIPFAFVGCIKDGRFESEGRQSAALRHPAFRVLEGRTIRVEGSLSPGDRFGAFAVFIVDEQCLSKFHQSYLLCQPCGTLPHMPHKDARRREPGTAMKLPPEALKELNNFGRSDRS